MYLVIFVRQGGEVSHDAKYNSLRATMNAVNDWFSETGGRGTVRIGYA